MFTDEMIGPEQQQEWFRKICMVGSNKYFVLEYQGRAVGLISFTGFDEENNLALWGFYIGEPDVPAGMGTILCLLGLDYAFLEWGLRRVIGEVLASNTRSLRLHERLGFVREGCSHAPVLKNGRYEDVIKYVLPAERWQTKRREISISMFGKISVGNVLSITHVASTDEQLRNGYAMNLSIKLGAKVVGPNQIPFIIAEMSGNHNHSLEHALAIVEAAANSGAHAVKLQTYTADTMTLDIDEGDFFISSPESLWNGQSLYKLYQQAYTPWEWHKPIFDRCRELGMVGFSTPFDDSSVDFLESLDVPCYKVASFENIDLPLIRKIAGTEKPMIISTGMATVAELDETVRAARESGCRDLILLKCTSSYPSTPHDTNIATIPHMRELFGCQVGLSDHTMGVGVAVASIALGATVVEKHFTLRRADGGVDSAFSLEPEELSSLVLETQRAWQSLGTVSYGPTASEKKSQDFRRSLYVVQDVKAGSQLTRDNVRSIRPGFGLSPKYFEIVLGKTVARDVKRGTPVTWGLLA